MTKVKKIGLIVEDDSDFDSMKNIISRIIGKESFTFKKAIGDGCGKLRRKAASYAQNLHKKGCNLIILVHDLDRYNLLILQKDLEKLLLDSKANHNFVCIPIEEIEAWFLSDPDAIQESFVLKRKPNIKFNPETIKSPKEELGRLVYSCSDKTTVYINTKHNAVLSKKVSITKMKEKCNSFRLFYNFIVEKSYA